jgi:hypothetical protein
MLMFLPLLCTDLVIAPFRKAEAGEASAAAQRIAVPVLMISSLILSLVDDPIMTATKILQDRN